jgi:hypothetical protein
VFDTLAMPTPAEFLRSLGADLARYDRPRVAKIGCVTGLALLVLGIAAGVAGLLPVDPIFPRFTRILVGLTFGGILLVFVIFALLETFAERRARARIAIFVEEGGADLPTLLEMAQARRGRFPGSEKVIGILERLA